MIRSRQRALGLLPILCCALVLFACGRASIDEINQALNITPTATEDATLVAAQTATADAAPTLADGTPAGGSAITGNAGSGRSRFQFQCMQCHRADGSGQGPNLVGIDFTLTYEEMLAVLRGETGHTAFTEFQLTDTDVANILAYLEEESTP